MRWARKNASERERPKSILSGAPPVNDPSFRHQCVWNHNLANVKSRALNTRGSEPSLGNLWTRDSKEALAGIVREAQVSMAPSLCRPSPATTRSLSQINAPPPPSALRLHVAHCIVGLVRGGKARRDDRRRGWGITDSRMHGQMQAWANELAGNFSIDSDFFFRLDLRLDVKPRRTRSTGTIPLDTPGYSPSDTPECNISGATQDRSVLNGAIAALRPVSVRVEPLPCYCAQRNCSCVPPVLGLSWWAQMQKVAACFADVVAYEHKHRFRYTHVTKLRSDYDLGVNGLSAAALAYAMHGTSANRSGAIMPRLSISGHPWNVLYGNLYGNLDWFWLAPRALARAAFGMVEANCEWFECERVKFGLDSLKHVPAGHADRHGEFITADGILAEWWLAQGAVFEALLADSAELRVRSGHSQNDACVYPAYEEGLITKEHVNHRDAHGRVRICPITPQLSVQRSALSIERSTSSQ